jgi:hypothetical protein
MKKPARPDQAEKIKALNPSIFENHESQVRLEDLFIRQLTNYHSSPLSLKIHFIL